MSVLVFKILHCTSFHQITLRGQLLLLILINFFFCARPFLLFKLLYLHYMLSIECRSQKNFNSIFEFMNEEKLMLRSFIDGVELSVFTSNELNVDSRGTLHISFHELSLPHP